MSYSPIASAGPWLMLPSRLVLFALCQGLFALILGSWVASIAWWPLAATVANLVTIGLLALFFQYEDKSFWSLFRLERGSIGNDLLVVVVAVVAAGILAYLPNVALAYLLLGSPEASLELFLRPLPFWAVLSAFAFPVTIMLAELPLYYGYVMPRLEAQTGSRWFAILAAGSFHALQHVTLPLVFDLPFVLWRGLMFLPFALFVAILLRWRPRLLPYLVVVHGLLDLSLVFLLMEVSAGA